MQRFFCAMMTMLVLQLCSLPYTSLAYGQDQSSTNTDISSVSQSLELPAAGTEISAVSQSVQLPAAAPAEEPRIAFKSGVKYDPTVHSWVDRYSGKNVDLGIPGVIGRYGIKNVIADNDVVADSSGPGTSGGPSTGPTFHYFTFKNFIIITILGLGIATAIAVPIGINAGHNNSYQQHLNQLAIYSWFHNQTLPIPKILYPPLPSIYGTGESGGGGGGGGGQVLKLLLGK